MSEITYYVVQGFEWTPSGRYQALEPVQATGRGHAIRAAQSLGDRGGAVAFSRTGDPETGEYSEALVLATFGRVPSGYLAAA